MRYAVLVLLALGQQPSPKELVDGLGSPTYTVREDASKALTELGDTAFEALDNAMCDSDAERRSRAFELRRPLVHQRTWNPSPLNFHIEDEPAVAAFGRLKALDAQPLILRMADGTELDPQHRISVSLQRASYWEIAEQLSRKCNRQIGVRQSATGESRFAQDKLPKVQPPVAFSGPAMLRINHIGRSERIEMMMELIVKDPIFITELRQPAIVVAAVTDTEESLVPTYNSGSWIANNPVAGPKALPLTRLAAPTKRCERLKELTVRIPVRARYDRVTFEWRGPGRADWIGPIHAGLTRLHNDANGALDIGITVANGSSYLIEPVVEAALADGTVHRAAPAGRSSSLAGPMLQFSLEATPHAAVDSIRMHCLLEETEEELEFTFKDVTLSELARTPQ